ncbi:hypothetical protein [Streptomyces sp. NPDC051577]|uniref:hypothetical protein n=1 Tax=Streptomyces sp. NPDC051577 TaxID=3155166 RepID=UPI00344276F3
MRRTPERGAMVAKYSSGSVYIAGAAPLGRLLGVSAWLVVVSGLALLIGGGTALLAAASPTQTASRVRAEHPAR